MQSEHNYRGYEDYSYYCRNPETVSPSILNVLSSSFNVIVESSESICSSTVFCLSSCANTCCVMATRSDTIIGKVLFNEHLKEFNFIVAFCAVI